MERLLFKSKGAPKKIAVLFGVCGSILLIIGILIAIISQGKRKTSRVYSGLYGDMEFRGEIGGGYLLNEDGRTIFFVIGIIIIMLAFLAFAILVSFSAGYCQFYEHHLEGANVFFMVKVCYHINYNEITSMNVMNHVLLINSIGKNQRIILCNEQSARKAYEIINDQLSRAKERTVINNNLPIVGAIDGLNGEYRGRRFALHAGEICRIGRDSGCNIQLTHDKISRIHCTISMMPDGKYQILDSSSNGTYYNNDKLQQGFAITVDRGGLLVIGSPDNVFQLQ